MLYHLARTVSTLSHLALAFWGRNAQGLISIGAAAISRLVASGR
ncbi:hypothetical protein HMPREF0880_03255 [Yokenella regensburgei ATCC 43003]|nr:hypothetical protein HMPREF0880_03255 [Yokenella regensburgei ATCC 43003]